MNLRKRCLTAAVLILFCFNTFLIGGCATPSRNHSMNVDVKDQQDVNINQKNKDIYGVGEKTAKGIEFLGKLGILALTTIVLINYSSSNKGGTR